MVAPSLVGPRHLNQNLHSHIHMHLPHHSSDPFPRQHLPIDRTAPLSLQVFPQALLVKHMATRGPHQVPIAKPNIVLDEVLLLKRTKRPHFLLAQTAVPHPHVVANIQQREVAVSDVCVEVGPEENSRVDVYMRSKCGHLEQSYKGNQE